MKSIARRWPVAGTALLLMILLEAVTWAQKDSIFLQANSGDRNSLVRGQIVGTTAFNVTIKTDSGQQEIPVSKIRKLAFSGEPRALDRARDHLANERYDECLTTIRKLDDTPESRFIQQQIKFLEAMAAGNIALRGDPAMPAETAEQLVGSFIKANSDSYGLVVAVDLYGQLLMSRGKLAAAQKEFNKLTKSKWPEYENRGYFFEGETLIHQDQLDTARQSFTALMNQSGVDEATEDFKLLAQCQLARISALQGDVAPAIAAIEKIIQEQNVENTRLFAYAYNALGTCYLQSNELKKARDAFLHTQLLFSTEPDAHAESLYRLSKIWSELKETDRANETRELLTSRYRNTIWGAKL